MQLCSVPFLSDFGSIYKYIYHNAMVIIMRRCYNGFHNAPLLQWLSLCVAVVMAIIMRRCRISSQERFHDEHFFVMFG